MDVDEFQEQSRLHFIGDWKYTARDIMREILVEKSIPKEVGASIIRPESDVDACSPGSSPKHPCVVHVDMDCFFASIAMRGQPELQNVPLAICHAGKYSEIASCNYTARKRGVCNGMLLSNAKRVCPELRMFPYEFDEYRKTMRHVYVIVLEMLSALHQNVLLEDRETTSVETSVEVTAIDDFLIGFLFTSQTTETGENYENQWIAAVQDKVVRFVQRLRWKIFQDTKCEASAGIARNVLVARILTDSAKLNGQKAFFGDALATTSLLEGFAVNALPGIGPNLTKKIRDKLGTTKCREVQLFDAAFLQRALGKSFGKRLFRACHGQCERSVTPTLPSYQTDQPVNGKLLSCCINYGVRPTCIEDVHRLLKKLLRNISEKMTTCAMMASSLLLSVKRRHPAAPMETVKKGAHGWCQEFALTQKISPPNNDQNMLCSALEALFDSSRIALEEVRGLTVKVKVCSAKRVEKQVSKAMNGTLTQFCQARTGSSKRTSSNMKAQQKQPKVQTLHRTFAGFQCLGTDFDQPFSISGDLPERDFSIVSTHLHSLTTSLSKRKYKSVQDNMLFFKANLSTQSYLQIRSSVEHWTASREGAMLVLP
ncbi:DNA damage repair protein [Perkinsela sp. CCAP 1560/4]|nr:DNA damage repair protein [Perkinsela sp. CCAP 1560/4]|eukprot:KNH07157.1 DNA damage repair protein [Perkinsela sp. CCAP 1560/4]